MKSKLKPKDFVGIGLALTMAGSLLFAYEVGHHSTRSIEQEAIKVQEAEAVKKVNDVLLSATVNNTKPVRVYPVAPEFRKDTWTWFWNEKAHLTVDSRYSLWWWGNDRISEFGQGLAEGTLIPAWNTVMEYDIARCIFLLFASALTLVMGVGFLEELGLVLGTITEASIKFMVKRCESFSNLVGKCIGKFKKA